MRPRNPIAERFTTSDVIEVSDRSRMTEKPSRHNLMVLAGIEKQ
jgi:hypothetical protein